MMPGGWLLIDMPGLREVQLWAVATLWTPDFGIFRNWQQRAGFTTADMRASQDARW